MSRTIHFRVEGETEKFLQEMNKAGLSERDVFAKALGLLNLVHKTGRVALLRPDAELRKYADELIDFVFTLEELEPAKQKGFSKSSRSSRSKSVEFDYEDDEDSDISQTPLAG
jgi:hypothetical protein